MSGMHASEGPFRGMSRSCYFRCCPAWSFTHPGRSQQTEVRWSQYRHSARSASNVSRASVQILTLASYVGYGLTETSPVAHILPRDKFLSKAGSAGTLLPNLEARLVGDDGVDVKPGERGELWLRGPTVMKVGVRAGRRIGLTCRTPRVT